MQPPVHDFQAESIAGTLGGTLLTILVYVQTEDVVKTAILAGVGALVSFAVTASLRAFIEWIKEKRR
jgi:hypothetical protein